MNRTVDDLIIPYARRRTLELVLSLSGYEADKDAYLEAKGLGTRRSCLGRWARPGRQHRKH